MKPDSTCRKNVCKQHKTEQGQNRPRQTTCSLPEDQAAREKHILDRFGNLELRKNVDRQRRTGREADRQTDRQILDRPPPKTYEADAKT